MHMMMGAEYGDTYWDSDAVFTDPYQGRPISGHSGDGFGFEGQLLDREALRSVKRHDEDRGVYVWEIAIPWSPGVTGLVGYDGKILGLNVTVCGDKLFNTDQYARIMLVDPEAVSLSLAADVESLKEGNADGVTFTVTRTGDLSEPLELAVASSDPAELSVPSSVVIPAGRDSITFTGTAIRDGLKDGDQSVTITVSSQGPASAEATILVLDSAPQIPGGFSIENIETNSISLAWNDAGDAVNYVLQFRESGETAWNPGPEAVSISGKWAATVGSLISDTSYEFRLRAKNEDGESDWAEITARTEPLPIIRPVAVIENADSLFVQEGCSLLVSAAGSEESRTRGFTYLWDFSGNGDFKASGHREWFHAKNINGSAGISQSIRLKVRDAEGNESEIAEANVTILDVAPTYRIDGPKAGELLAGRVGYWEFSAQDVPGDPIVKWNVNWGDGTETELSGGPRTWFSDSHFYREAKHYVITVSSTDVNGDVSTFTLDAIVTENDFPARSVIMSENHPDVPASMGTLETTAIPTLEEEIQSATTITGSREFRLQTAPAETMRLRLMLDLDQSRTQNRESDRVRFSEQIWTEEGWFGHDGFDFSGGREETDFWSEILEPL